MKKYIFLFVISSGFGISHAFAQNQAATAQTQTAAVSGSTNKQGNDSHTTVANTDKNQQSVYTPSSNDEVKSNDAPASQPALPLKAQPAIVDPKKQY